MSQIRVGEWSENPLEAKEIAIQCPHCQKLAYVKLPYKPTMLQRQTLIREAIDLHRRDCPAAPSDAGRVLKISYPRKS